LAGYSGTPLIKKLGIAAGMRLFLDGEPANYLALIGPLPEDATVFSRGTGKVDLIHLFTTDAAALAKKLQAYRKRIEDDGVIWVSWPKKAANVATDVTEDVVREKALPLGLVDVKVCAVDETWSGLKLVIRRELRGAGLRPAKSKK
jgi:hypothetical protein